MFRKKQKKTEPKNEEAVPETPSPPKEEVNEETPEGYYVASIPVQTEPVIVHSNSKEQYDIISGIARIMNDIAEIKAMIKKEIKE